MSVKLSSMAVLLQRKKGIFGLLYPAFGDCHEAFDLCSLCCVCVWRSERAEACMAAIARTYASADMAGESA